MAEKDIAPTLREKSESQTLAEKSRVIKLAFSAHNRHGSSGLVKETLNSKPNSEELANFSEIIEELEFQVVEVKVNKKTETSSMENLVCFFVLHFDVVSFYQAKDARYQQRRHVPRS